MNSWFSRLSRRLEPILGSPTPIIFAIGLLGVGLITDALSTWISEIFNNPLITIVIGLGLLIAAMIVGFELPDWLRRRALRNSSIIVSEPVPQKRGLIALVSMGRHVPARGAIEHHAGSLSDPTPYLTHAWLLAGPGEGDGSSVANASHLKDEYGQRGVNIEIIQLDDIDDPHETFEKVDAILSTSRRLHSIPLEDMIADYTGGTKSMTFGLALACSKAGCQIQFMKPLYLPDGSLDMNKQPVPKLVNVDFLYRPANEKTTS